LERVKLARGNFIVLDRVALAVKCSHVLEKATSNFGRQFERGALEIATASASCREIRSVEPGPR